MKTTKTIAAFVAALLAVAPKSTATATATPEVTHRLGNINHDESIDASDASVVLEYYAAVMTGSTNSNPTDIYYADVNRDGIVDPTDASNILEYYSTISVGGSPGWPIPKYSLAATYMFSEAQPLKRMNGQSVTLGSGEHFSLEGANSDMSALYLAIPKANEVFVLELTPEINQEIIRVS